MNDTDRYRGCLACRRHHHNCAVPPGHRRFPCAGYERYADWLRRQVGLLEQALDISHAAAVVVATAVAGTMLAWALLR